MNGRRRIVFALGALGLFWLGASILCIRPVCAGCVDYERSFRPLGMSSPAPEGGIGGISGTVVYLQGSGSILPVDVADPAALRVGTRLEIPGPLHPLALDEARGFLTAGQVWERMRLVALDLSDPMAPVVRAEIPMEANGTALALDGDFLYTIPTDWRVRSQIHRYDVSNLSEPRWVDSLVVSLLDESSLTAGGGRLCVFSADSLSVYNTRPSVPVRQGTIALPAGSWPRAMALSGGLLYVASSGLTILDVSGPRAPVIRYWKTGVFGSDVAHGLTVAGDYLLCRRRSNSFAIDVADSRAPVALGDIPSGFLPLRDGAALVGTRPTDPGDPLLASLIVTGPARQGSVSPLYTGRPIGLRKAMAGTLPPIPSTPLGSSGPAAIPASHVCVAAEGSIGVLAGVAGIDWMSYGRIRSFDLSDPTCPVSLASTDEFVDGPTWDLKIRGERAFRVADPCDLEVYDLTDPRHPRRMGRLPGPEIHGGRLAFEGSHVYVAQGTLGLRVVDAADPARLRLRGEFPGRTRAVAVSGGLALIAGGDQGLRIADVQDPDAPALIQSFATPGGVHGARDVCVRESCALIADGPAGLVVVDFSNPADPRIAAALSIVGGAEQIRERGGYAFVAGNPVEGFSHLEVFDIRRPLEPRYVGAVYPDRAFADMTVTDSLLIVAHPEGYLTIYPSPCVAALPAPETRRLRLVPEGGNPGSAGFSFRVEAGSAAPVKVGVYDITGRRVRGFPARWIPAGSSILWWNGRDDAGERVGAGCYFVRGESGGDAAVGRVVIVR